MTQLSLRERRLLAMALLMVVLTLLLYGLVMPVIDGFASRADTRAALAQTYERDERAIIQVQSARRAAEAQRRDQNRFRLAGSSQTAAADRLKERLAAAVTASGGSLRSVEDVAAGPGMIRVGVDARLTTAQLATTLATIERGEPLLALESLAVNADQSLQTGRASPLDVRLEASGLYPAATPR